MYLIFLCLVLLDVFFLINGKYNYFDKKVKRDIINKVNVNF